MMQHDATASPKGVYEARKKLPQHFHIPKARPQFAITVVFTRNARVRDHEPLKTISGYIHRDFEVDTRTFDLPPYVIKQIEDSGWVQDLSPGKDHRGRPLKKVPHLEFFCRVTLRHDNKSIDVGYEILDPKNIPWRSKSSSYCELNNYADTIAEEEKPTEEDLMGQSLKSKWVTIWAQDTHALKSSLSDPNAQMQQSIDSASRANGATGYDADNEETRVSLLLNGKLHQSRENADDDASLARRAVLNNASMQEKPAIQGTNAAGKKRKSNESPKRSPKRANNGPQQMSAPDVNSRARAGPSTVSYEGPSWLRGDLNFF
jgi:hypothetical protein